MNIIDDRKKINSLTRSAAGAFNAEILECKVLGNGATRVIRCVADYPSGGITIDVCSGINKKIVAMLEDDESVDVDVSVEVNSPGLDRPLKTMSDFLRAKGKTISLWLNAPVDEKMCIEVVIVGNDDETLCVDYKGKEVRIKEEDIKLGKQKIEIK